MPADEADARDDLKEFGLVALELIQIFAARLQLVQHRLLFVDCLVVQIIIIVELGTFDLFILLALLILVLSLILLDDLELLHGIRIVRNLAIIKCVHHFVSFFEEVVLHFALQILRLVKIVIWICVALVFRLTQLTLNFRKIILNAALVLRNDFLVILFLYFFHQTLEVVIIHLNGPRFARENIYRLLGFFLLLNFRILFAHTLHDLLWVNLR